MSTFKLALVSVLALGLAVPAFAQTAAMPNSTSTPATSAKVETNTTPTKIETKSNESTVANSKPGVKNVRTVSAKVSKSSSLHKVSHKKHDHKKAVQHSISKM